MKRHIIFISFLLAGWFSGLSQSSLGIDSINFSAPAGATYNSQCVFRVNVVNYGPQPYNYSIDMHYVIDSTGTGINMIDTSNSHLASCNLTVGASQPDSAVITIGNSFRHGINTVVIWPRTMDNISTTHDSLKINFMVVTTGIRNFTEARPVVFPNPAQQSIQVLSFDPKFVVERVRIWSPGGDLLQSTPFTGKLDVTQLAPGVYFLELVSQTGAITRYKVIKE